MSSIDFWVAMSRPVDWKWNLESIVKEILPDGSYNFQVQINKETQDRVDCAVKTADGLTIPIDSKFYAGQYKQYQEASRDNERGNVLRDLRTAILRDADDIASKYIRQNTTSNYAVLYIASEKLIDLVDDIENLRQDCLAEKSSHPRTKYFGCFSRYHQNRSSLSATQ